MRWPNVLGILARGSMVLAIADVLFSALRAENSTPLKNCVPFCRLP